jgi:hypothetical protein
MEKRKDKEKRGKEEIKRKGTPGGEYSTGTWSGKTRYQCNLCEFDVLEDEQAMLEHSLSAHSSEKALDALIEQEAEAPAAIEPEAYPETPKEA